VNDIFDQHHLTTSIADEIAMGRQGGGSASVSASHLRHMQSTSDTWCHDAISLNQIVSALLEEDIAVFRFRAHVAMRRSADRQLRVRFDP